MKSSWHRFTSISMVAVAISCSTSVWGEQQKESPNETDLRDQSAAGIISPRENDSRIARWIAVDNRMILGCAKLGKERTDSSSVREFAETLIADHQKCLDEFEVMQAKNQKISKEDNAPNGKNAKQQAKISDESKEEARESDRARIAILTKDDGKSRGGAMLYQPTDFLMIREEVSKHLKDAVKEEWEGVSDADFNREFLRHQVMAHKSLLASMRAVYSTASSTMQATLDKRMKTIAKHLELAQSLEKTTKATAESR